MSAAQTLGVCVLILVGGLAFIGVVAELVIDVRRRRRARAQAAWERDIEHAIRISGGTP